MPRREPEPAEEITAARALVGTERHGVLSTAHAREGGWPFGSIVPYAVLPEGDPVVWLSGIAEHTRNLAADPRSCLLVNDSTRLDDVQAAPRVALLARASVLAGPAAAVAEEAYLARFPDSGAMASAHDFAFHVLRVEKVRWIAGFGSMGWVTRAEWGAAAADPLEPYAAAIAEHLNEDHAGALLELAAHVARIDGSAARVTGVDAGGLTLEVAPRGRGKPQAARIPFPAPCATPDAVRKTVIAMLALARKKR
jgi:heme iron utilization protein